jgi:hypothetical protein
VLQAARASVANTLTVAGSIQEELHQQRVVLMRSSDRLVGTGLDVDQARAVLRRMGIRERRLFLCVLVTMVFLVTGAVAGLVYFAIAASGP